MSARVIVTGTITKPVARKTSAKGKDYLLATIREGGGDTARFWSLFVFAEALVEEIAHMQVGEPVSVTGELEAKNFTPQGGEPRVSLSIKVDGVLTARRPPKKEAPEKDKTSGRGESSAQKGRSDLDDAIPF